MTVQVSEPADGVRMITLNRPEALNALTRDMVAELSAALDEVERDERCRTVILTGAGRSMRYRHLVAAAADRRSRSRP